MVIDIAQAVGLVHREISTIELDGKPGLRVVASRTYETDINDAWDALTNPERIGRWFLPVSGELELGGRYQLDGNAGGEIKRCEPPRELAITWEYAGDVSQVSVSLSEVETSTRLELIHDAHIDPDFHAKYGPGAGGVGWDLSFVAFAEFFANAQPIVAELEAWTTSANGIAFTTACCDAWAEADIAIGTDPDAARARAAQTLAFYSGAEPS